MKADMVGVTAGPEAAGGGSAGVGAAGGGSAARTNMAGSSAGAGAAAGGSAARAANSPMTKSNNLPTDVAKGMLLR
jgi:20S proteasome alpha/beta subunit